MREFAISVVGRDRPGIAAGIAAALVKAEANIEDSRMTILRGHFTIMMLIALPESADAAALEADLEAVRERLGLGTVIMRAVESATGPAAVPTHVLTVYGADHPGIVNAVCEALASENVNIDDLATRVAGAEDKPIYMMLCELTLPTGLEPDRLKEVLATVAGQQGVEVSLRELEEDVI